MEKNMKIKFLHIQTTKDTRKHLRDIKYWLDENYRDLIARLVKEEWEKIRPKSS